MRLSTVQLPNVQRYFGDVRYMDPLGAWPAGTSVTSSITIHMTKVFRYACQREFRFAFVPKCFRERLEPKCLWIGPISDIAEFVWLPQADGCGG